MERTGSLFTLLILLIWPVYGNAQTVDLQASLSESNVFVGEQYSFTIEVKGDRIRNIEMPEPPEVEGSRLLSPTPSRGQRISIINGRTTTVNSYSFRLLAQEAGQFQIPSVSIKIDGKVYRTEPLAIEVYQNTGSSEGAERRPDIFAEISLDNEEPMVGEQIIASLDIYFREGVEVTSYQPAGGWRTDGFWMEQLENIEQPTTETVVLGGVRYRRATLLRYALFPSRPGDLVLSPYELHLGIRTRPNRNDPFGSVFGGLGSNQRRVTLETDEITLPVQRLDEPEEGEPIGAVGTFDIQRQPSVRQAYVGEPVELRTTISGRGNLPLLSRPSYPLPDSFERYTPEEETDLSRRGSAIRGTRTFTERFVPRVAGSYTIPEMVIPVYNPERSGYQYHRLPRLTLEILQNPNAAIAQFQSEADLQILKGLALWKQTNNRIGLFGRWWLWAGLLIPVVALWAGWNQKQKQDLLRNDRRYARAHYAWEQAESTLVQAEEEASGSTPKQAYHYLHKAISGYIADRLGLPEAGLSDQDLSEAVQNKTSRPELSKQLKQMLDKCASISYAPVGNRENIEQDIEQARTLLQKLREDV